MCEGCGGRDGTSTQKGEEGEIRILQTTVPQTADSQVLVEVSGQWCGYAVPIVAEINSLKPVKSGHPIIRPPSLLIPLAQVPMSPHHSLLTSLKRPPP